MSEQSSHSRRVLAVIIAALSIWGAYHTIGIFRSESDLSKALIKAAVVLTAMALFLGGWGLLLWLRKRRLSDRANRSEHPVESPRAVR